MEHNNKSTALLVMDFQEATLKMVTDSAAFSETVNKVILAARCKQIPVIYVVVAFRKGFPEMSPHNKSYLALKNGTFPFDTPEAARVHTTVAPLPGEMIIGKKRFSAFSGSDLEIILRSMEIKHLVLTGISTSGVVLSTVREAADKDYELTVLADCCADRDEEVHRVLTTKVFPRQADVLSAAEWLTVINKKS